MIKKKDAKENEVLDASVSKFRPEAERDQAARLRTDEAA